MAASLNSSFSSKKIEQVSSGIKRNGPEVSQEVSVSKRKNIETSTSREVEKSNGISSNRLSYEMNDMSNNNRSQFYRYIDVIENTDQHAAAQIAHRFSGDSLAEFMINFSEKNQLYMGTQGKNPWEKNSLENCVRMIHNITYPEDNDPFRGSYVGQLFYMMKIPNQQDNKYYQLVIGKEGKEESLSKQGQVNNMTIITFTERNWSDGFKDPVEALMLDKTYEERTSYLRDYDEFKQEMSYRWDHSYNSEFKGEYKNKGDFYKQSIL